MAGDEVVMNESTDNMVDLLMDSDPKISRQEPHGPNRLTCVYEDGRPCENSMQCIDCLDKVLSSLDDHYQDTST